MSSRGRNSKIKQEYHKSKLFDEHSGVVSYVIQVMKYESNITYLELKIERTEAKKPTIINQGLAQISFSLDGITSAPAGQTPKRMRRVHKRGGPQNWSCISLYYH